MLILSRKLLHTILGNVPVKVSWVYAKDTYDGVRGYIQKKCSYIPTKSYFSGYWQTIFFYIPKNLYFSPFLQEKWVYSAKNFLYTQNTSSPARHFFKKVSYSQKRPLGYSFSKNNPPRRRTLSKTAHCMDSPFQKQHIAWTHSSKNSAPLSWCAACCFHNMVLRHISQSPYAARRALQYTANH